MCAQLWWLCSVLATCAQASRDEALQGVTGLSDQVNVRIELWHVYICIMCPRLTAILCVRIFTATYMYILLYSGSYLCGFNLQ